MNSCIGVFLAIVSIHFLAGCGADPVHTQLDTGSVTDVEGNIYKTVRIGNQWWMAENLKCTTYRGGELISRIDNELAWETTTQPAYCNYNNLSGFGLLYNYHVLTSGKDIAPEGWHVATDEDWKELEAYLGMSPANIDGINWRGTLEGDQLKEKTTNLTGWVNYDGVWGTNVTGFSAAGGSCRVFNGEWGVPGLRHSGFWWCATQEDDYGYFRYLDYKKSGIFRYTAHPNYGFSIRCVKN